MGEPGGPQCRCCGGETPAEALPCPGCGQTGRTVEARTLRALLAPRWAGEVPEGPWRFCASPACDFVYFGPGGSYRKDQLRVRVGLKETEAPRPLCYCFGHSEESLRAQWQATGRLDAVAAIRAAVQEGRCRCDLENPSGTCCLGDVLKVAQAFGTA